MTKAEFYDLKHNCEMMGGQITSLDWRVELGNLIYCFLHPTEDKLVKVQIAQITDKTELSMIFSSYLLDVQPSRMLKLLDLIDVESLPDE